MKLAHVDNGTAAQDFFRVDVAELTAPGGPRSTYGIDMAAAWGRAVQQGHTDYCTTHGHARYLLPDGELNPAKTDCPRCGRPAADPAPATRQDHPLDGVAAQHATAPGTYPPGTRVGSILTFDRSQKVAFQCPDHPAAAYMSKDPFVSHWFRSRLDGADCPAECQVRTGDMLTTHAYTPRSRN